MKRTVIFALALSLTRCWIYVPADVVVGNGDLSCAIYGSGNIDVWGWGRVTGITDTGSGRFTSHLGEWR